MTTQSHDDTHNRLRALETASQRQERLLERIGEAVQELANQQALYVAYQKQHDQNTERTGQRLGELEDEYRDHSNRVNKLIHTGYGVWAVVAVILTFGGSYLVEGLLRLNSELHRQDKRIELIEHELRGGGIKASLTSEDTCPKPEDPKPKPEQAWTNKPGI